jgi:hypothetical protein
MNKNNLIVNDNLCFLGFLLLITLTYIQIICSLDTTSDGESENKFDGIQQIPSLLGEQPNTAECLSKDQLAKLLNRDRRASISRPYFRHWRQTRGNIRYSTTDSLVFSSRLGKRAYENENPLDHVDQKFVARSIDFNTFLVTFADHLQDKQIDILYEDPIKICLSQPINDAFIQQVLEKIAPTRRNQDEQDKEEIRGRPTIAKHPVLFRYRLG